MNIDVLSNLVITKVRSASTMYTVENGKGKTVNRPRWAIALKHEGEPVYTSNGKQVLSNLNHAVILPKGCTYEWTCTKAGHFSIIELESEPTYTDLISCSCKNGEKLLKQFKDLEHKRILKKPMMELECIRDIYSIILALTQEERERYLPTEKQQKIAPAIEYIFQNYDKNISNDELSSLTGLSTVYFRKLFTRIMGISPITYVHRLRIQKAKEMLKSDYGTLSDIAQCLGYSNLYDFSRDFKKHTGVSPSKYESK